MKKNLPLLLIVLIVFQFTAIAQFQWYQNQDGNNTYPNGTYATCIQPLTRGSFVSCYLWKTENDTYTWKISKSRYSGEEVKTFLISGSSAAVEMKAGKRNTVYLLKKTYPPGSNAEYILYKLDSNLNIRNEKTISFPGDFQIFNLNKFIVDESDNVYIAGDGQYPANGDLPLASFVSKSDRQLNTIWSRFDTATTSFTDIQVDIHGRVYVIGDHYSFFPDVHLYSFTRNGNLLSKKTITLSAERLNVNTQLNDDNDLFFYGMKSTGNFEQAIYLSRYSLSRSVFKYNKTLYTAPGSILIDLKKDNDDNFLMLSMQYYANGDVKNRVSSINAHYGAVHWQRSYLFANDSSNFTRIAVGSNNRFYIMGEKRTLNNNYTKGIAIRLNRHGFSDRRFNGPDSVAYQRSHWLTEGLVDREGDLISIGSTQDYDTINSTGTYFRSFAVKFGSRRGDCRDDDPGITSAAQTPEDISLTPSLRVFPNPAAIQLTISNIDVKAYNSFAVYNGQGAMIAKQSINSETEYFNTSKLTAGTYFILLQSNKGDAGNKKIQFAVSR
jgi:hypothetical protein